VFTDNGHIIRLYSNRKSFFERMVFQGRAYYSPGNRAARRVVNSNKFKNRMKKHEITFEYGDDAIILS
jgi:hypothetical protein